MQVKVKVRAPWWRDCDRNQREIFQEVKEIKLQKIKGKKFDGFKIGVRPVCPPVMSTVVNIRGRENGIVPMK